ncbi:MAG: RNA polymerase sigma factor [Phenylobacterium sp.]|nr:RNA polymerase sigma factor [Phenylobacterium sp.]
MTGSDEESDAELARRALEGEDHAFTHLMRRHKGWLYRFVRRYVGDADAAYEVVQESFVAAWRNLARYDSGRSFTSWMRAIALNKCRDRGRREAVRRVFFGADPGGEAVAAAPDPQPRADSGLIAAEQRRALDRAIAQLPAKLKEPLILTVFEELSQQAAGDVLGVSAKTIETRVYRARRRLAELLEVEDLARRP